MPLDNLQKRVLKVLLPLRSPESVFAGGAVLHRHGFRLSDDQDIFHGVDADILQIADIDIAALKSAGFTAERARVAEGFIEAIVGNEDEGSTRIQWIQAGAWTFFAPVPDPEYGWRLHMADLAVNKALAAGGRKQVRDYVDLYLIHKYLMPLWHVFWAAPGKDVSWSPTSLAEKIAMTNGFRQEEIDTEVLSAIPLSAAEIGGTVRDAVDEARRLFEKLPGKQAGRLFIDRDGNPVSDAADILTGRATPLDARKGGAWPSGPEIDRILVARLIDAFGLEGGKTAPM